MIVTLDTETLRWSDEVEGGWSNIKAFGLSIAIIAYRDHSDHYEKYDRYIPNDDVAKHFHVSGFDEFAEKLEGAERIVTFNGENFDFEVMESAGFDVSSWKDKSFDILARFHKAAGHRISLDNLAKAMLDYRKTDDGLGAVRKWRAGLHLLESDDILCRDVAVDLFTEVLNYCSHDVSLTQAIYRKLMAEGGWIGYPSRGGGMRKIRISLD